MSDIATDMGDAGREVARSVLAVRDAKIDEQAAEIERLRREKQVLLESGMQAKVAALVAAAAALHSAMWDAFYGRGISVEYAQACDKQYRDALAAADFECVPGWVRVWSDGHIEWCKTKEPPCDLPQDGVKSTVHRASIVIHKEKQHGA